MKRLLYIILATVMASCVGGSMPSSPTAAPADSDSVPTIVTIVDTVTTVDTTLLCLSPKQVDSLIFRLTHHYSENFNFVVKADSLTLIPREGDIITDTCHVYAGNIIVVADIRSVPGDSIDSIWIKVASNQSNMGWILEDELLASVTPDDPISEMLYALSSSRVIWMSALAALGIIAFILSRRKRKDSLLGKMPSIYPSLFLILVALMASIYASVQNFVPEFWQEYYFNPTLNPLVLPPLMAALVVVTWLVIITFIAVIDEVYHNFYFVQGITFLVELAGIAMIVYLVISWTTLVYIGYVLLLVLVWKLAQTIWSQGE